jgi:hypothetical protein
MYDIVWFPPVEYMLRITQLHRKLLTHEVAMVQSLYPEAEERDIGGVKKHHSEMQSLLLLLSQKILRQLESEKKTILL